MDKQWVGGEEKVLLFQLCIFTEVKNNFSIQDMCYNFAEKWQGW